MVADLFHHASEEKRLRAFKQFHRDNPHVWAEFERRALAMWKRLGDLGEDQRYSARTIIEVMRWHARMETTGDQYKFNDHHTPFYARMFLEEHPECAGFFERKG